MDLPLNDLLYAQFRDRLLSRYGLSYPERKRTDLTHGLSQAARAMGLPSLEALLTTVVADEAAWEQVVAHLTIGETYFFRNDAHFLALRSLIIPDLVERRAMIRGLRLWSAGCATGEEPYSLVMTLTDQLPPGWQFSILATDINPGFLERAREGLYGPWSFRETPDAARERFFTPEGARWRLRPEVRRLVVFARLNLAEACYPSAVNGTTALDLIFCRNVTIYFDEATTRGVVERFYGALAPGGWLVVGHAEPSVTLYQRFETHNVPGAVLYRKPLDAPIFGVGPLNLPPPTPRPLAQPPAPPPTPRPAPPPVARATPPPVAVAERAVAERPAAIAERARAAADRGEWAEAEELVAQALAADTLCLEAHHVQAMVYEHQGRLDDALAAYRRTLYLDRSFVAGAIGMASIWRQTGRAAEARRSYRNAISDLERLAPSEVIRGAGGTTASELLAFARSQLELLPEA